MRLRRYDSWLTEELDLLDEDERERSASEKELEEAIQRTREDISKAFGDKTEHRATLNPA